MNHRIVLIISIAFLCEVSANAANIFYVSPKGNDANDGKSALHAWKTCAKVNAAAFQPGDSVLFERGGEWREQLKVSSNGESDKPIVYDAYGTGAKPRFLGSDIVTGFTSAGENKYSFKPAAKCDAVLENHVFIPSTWDKDRGLVTISLGSTDPRSNGKVYTCCVRGNVVFAPGKKHIILRNLIADETAGQLDEGTVQGYGIRIEGCTDVRLEDCEAYRCGRHHFGAINSTGFVGRNLHAAYTQPDTPGGNSFYVSYADQNAPVPKCTSEWYAISGDHLEDGKNGYCIFFVSHGPNQGPILIADSDIRAKCSLMSAPVVIKGGFVRENGSVENMGKGILIDGLTLLDNSAIDQWDSDGIIQNCVAASNPTNNGPTGYSAAILCRDNARHNVVRFNTLVTRRFTCLKVLAKDAGTQWYGNIMITENSENVSLPDQSVGKADFNFYSTKPTICGITLEAWTAKGFDTHSLSGDPKFRDAAKGDYHLQSGSPCIGAVKIETQDIPASDFTGKKRAEGRPADIGAF